jgi:hypothetical protein
MCGPPEAAMMSNGGRTGVTTRHQSGERGTPRFTAFLRLSLSCSERISVLNELWLTGTHVMTTSSTVDSAARIWLA